MAQPEESATAHQILEQVKRKFGFVPNVLREMSASPPALQVYLGGQESLAHGSLTPQEQQAVQLTVSVFNRCDYCQTVHTQLSSKVGVSSRDIQAVRTGSEPGDDQLAAIVEAARSLLDRKGWLQDAEVRALEQRGVTRAKLYEIVAYIGLKTISNYVNHIAHTPIDKEFGT